VAEGEDEKRRVSAKELKKQRGVERKRSAAVEKEARMATSKASAKNFYTDANVKNRNLRRKKE
jgi:hypothetical protein